MARTLIKGGLVAAFGNPDAATTPADVRVEDGVIVAVGADLRPHEDETVLDARRRLVAPGMVNAHLHSFESPYRGRYENLPMELWALYGFPIGAVVPEDDELVYLRTMVVAIESLQSGVTTVVDDVDEWSGQTLNALGAVFAAYADIGLRANCSGNFQNLADVDRLPYAQEVMPADVLRRLGAGQRGAAEPVIEFLSEAARLYHRPDGLQRLVIAPCGPQWCSPDLLIASHALACELDVPYHLHLLETVIQLETQRIFFGGSLLGHMSELGVLDDHTTLAHAIWITDADVALLAASGARVVHNPISNLKLGAGVCPLRALLDAGVPVGLGTDGPSCNDTVRLSDTVRVAALLHDVTAPDHARWPIAREIMWAATAGGAQTAGLGDRVGTLEVGKRADLVLYDLDTIAFTPLFDVTHHLAYGAPDPSIRLVMVDGEVVVREGRCTRVDEEAILAAFRDRLGVFAARHGQLEEAQRDIEPYLAEIHRRAAAAQAGFVRAGAQAA